MTIKDTCSYMSWLAVMLCMLYKSADSSDNTITEKTSKLHV